MTQPRVPVRPCGGDNPPSSRYIEEQSFRERTNMDAAQLRQMQAPLKERYKTDPKAALITLKAKGSTDSDGIACKVETGRAIAMAGLHPATGGSGLELCSGDMLLEALVACAGVTLKSVATAIEVPLRTGNVYAEGDLDFRGTLGVDKETPVGFAEIRLRFEVDTDAPQDKLDLLLKLTERYCVVYQTIKNGPKVSVSMQRM
ncbi:OsmC family peroxiredoxin [Bradyrhizobium zhanjiangense]|uniref:OsmC family peroxiredoxin n=2 Tax=Bradyrhizobium zhanjiangense TaxID=1325107 RepID=A0A4Q0QJ12_9BRAD|nr:OsmC family peroxiredoxin [Bradyrhizobium zhanjiangense]RXG93357.1 OsmC family peroxiredoxin [Bradyrhizobium zhanjiangense]